MTHPVPPPVPVHTAHLWLLDGHGRATPLSEEQRAQWTPEQGCLWLDVTLLEKEPATPPTPQEWAALLGLEPSVATLTGDLDHHPRLVHRSQGVLLCLREVQMESATVTREPVPFNCWLDGQRLVTVHQQPIALLDALASEWEEGKGSAGGVGGVLRWMADRLARGEQVVANGLGRRVEGAGERVHEQDPAVLNAQLGQLRRMLGRLLLHLQPQAAVMRRLSRLGVEWLGEEERHHLAEAATRHARTVRQLVHHRERLDQVQEEFANHLDHRLNLRVYLLTVITGVFFPMVFLTGLLGVNVGGIPGADNPRAFAWLCLLLVLLGAGCAWWFHRRKWL